MSNTSFGINLINKVDTTRGININNLHICRCKNVSNQIKRKTKCLQKSTQTYNQCSFKTTSLQKEGQIQSIVKGFVQTFETLISKDEEERLNRDGLLKDAENDIFQKYPDSDKNAINGELFQYSKKYFGHDNMGEHQIHSNNQGFRAPKDQRESLDGNTFLKGGKHKITKKYFENYIDRVVEPEECIQNVQSKFYNSSSIHDENSMTNLQEGGPNHTNTSMSHESSKCIYFISNKTKMEEKLEEIKMLINILGLADKINTQHKVYIHVDEDTGCRIMSDIADDQIQVPMKSKKESNLKILDDINLSDHTAYSLNIGQCCPPENNRDTADKKITTIICPKLNLAEKNNEQEKIKPKRNGGCCLFSNKNCE